VIGKSIALLVLAVAVGIDSTAVEATSKVGSAAPKYFAHITPFQQQMIEKWVNPEAAPAELRAAVADAAPTIKTLLAEASCRANYDPKLLNLPVADRTPYNDAGPMTELTDNQHRNTLCLTVDKITHWNLIGLDTLGFEVLYRSDDSLETVKKRYAATRQSKGEWHIDYWAKPQTAQPR